jgi:WD40 repeat protein
VTLDIKQAAVVQQWPHDRPLTACRIEPQGRFAFCGAEDAGLHRFQLTDGAKVSFVGGHETWVQGIACLVDGSQVISGGLDGRLAWWDAAAAEPTPPIRKLDAHAGWIRTMELRPAGDLLATAGNDLVVRLWNPVSGELVRELRGHERHIYCLAFHPTGEFLLTGDLMGKIKQWRADTGELIREIDAAALHSYNDGQQVDFGGVRGIAVSPDGRFLAAGGLHKASNPLGAVHEPLVQLYNWETTTDAPKSLIAEGITQGVVWRLQYLPDGTLLGVSGGGSGGHLIFWNSDSEKDVHRFQLPNLARDMDWHAATNQVATAHYDRHLRVTRLGPA